NAIVIRDSEETLMLTEESRSKMLLKQKDPMISEKKTELSAEQVFWSQNSVNSEEPNISTRPTQVEVPKELPKVNMVYTSLKKLKHHHASFDVVVKERTTATAITEGTWGRSIKFRRGLLEIKCTRHSHCQVKCSHWQYKFPLPVKVVPTARRLEMPLPGVCTAIEEMMKKLPVKDRWQLH
nr:hypothetical protein [Tanacetum cinerariifolium]